MNFYKIIPLLAVFSMPTTAAIAQDQSGELAELRQLVSDMRSDYDARISELEDRLATAERAARSARRDAEEAMDVAEETAINQGSAASSLNTFNPGIGLVLVGNYADVGQGWDVIPGFQPGGEIGTGGSGFSLGESELNLQSSVDAGFYGNVTIALAEDDGETEVGLEEVWLQTTNLRYGLSLLGGRFFSGAGYLNSFHAHADDFTDRPLPYQAFFGGQYGLTGLQARWVAPTKLLFELGAEIDWGGGFPATGNSGSSPGSKTLFTKIGGDVGDSNSWQAGLSYITTEATDRPGSDPLQSFTGDSDLTVVDFVWKWAPGGNTRVHSLKAQGEYFRRSENGSFAGVNYNGDQSGWYLQGVWQFAQTWRLGLRHDQVDAGSGPLLAGTDVEDPGRNPYRNSLMVDWSPSEFSRIRLQYTNDNVLTQSDDQWFLQYLMSLGAHGAHQF